MPETSFIDGVSNQIGNESRYNNEIQTVREDRSIQILKLSELPKHYLFGIIKEDERLTCGKENEHKKNWKK